MKKKIFSWMRKVLLLIFVLVGGLVQVPLSSCAAQVSAEPARIELEDGTYSIAVELSGGTQRATVASPAQLIVKDGLAYARIEWSSSHYDYMIVDGQKYLPINEGGNSVFEIPILVFDEEMPVTADTTAMSVPHEIEYGLFFHADEILSGNQTSGAAVGKTVLTVLLIAVLCAAVLFVFKRRRNPAR